MKERYVRGLFKQRPHTTFTCGCDSALVSILFYIDTEYFSYRAEVDVINILVTAQTTISIR